MARIEFKITSDEEASFNAVKTVYRTIGLMQQSRQAGAATQADIFLVVLFGHKVLTFRVKTLCLTFTGCT